MLPPSPARPTPPAQWNAFVASVQSSAERDLLNEYVDFFQEDFRDFLAP
jgi:hypothetical protein